LKPSVTEQSYNNVFSVNISDIVCNRTTFGGVIVSVLASSGVDFWSSHGLVKPNTFKIGIHCFSTKHAALIGFESR